MCLIRTFKKSAVIILFAVLLLSPLAMLGCNTVNGLGKDIEKGGQKLQNVSGEKSQEW